MTDIKALTATDLLGQCPQAHKHSVILLYLLIINADVFAGNVPNLEGPLGRLFPLIYHARMFAGLTTLENRRCRTLYGIGVLGWINFFYNIDRGAK